MRYRIALLTIVTKEVRRFMRIWPQTMLPPAITTALYFLIFGTLMGQRIGDISGASYMDYIVPGIILMSVISHSYANVVSSFYSTKFQRHIEELLVSPVPNWVILAGYVSGGVCRGLLVGTVVIGISLLFTTIPVNHLGLSCLVFLLTAILFALAGFINAVFADSFDDISIIPNFILTPLTYLGGVFYSVDMLPELWQKISLANPILYIVNSFRYGLIGVTDIDITVALTMIISFIVALIIFSLYLLKKGVGIKQ
ncbi:MAG: ABC transporter permease [Methylococcales bacterium]|jgi:ABC-2 type transport system permease protein|nr:ABC transporter permease [Methylococcales bacterium]MBT4347393.1 ABC transporter permease [Methylococcales bacterium]MBT4598845.1 ABC transporter permease [Methylococcales bacterium]MBT6794661.1 ABC transporter permease [Methylococcales bacterium]MBT7108974.1 ABC transporter permease [Methylococcales bacterium]